MAWYSITRRKLAIVGVSLGLFAVGVLAGLFVPPEGPRSAVAAALARLVGADEPEAPHEEHADDAPHVDLSQRAMDQLGLDVVPLVIEENEFAWLRMPGQLVEKPAASDLAVASTVEAVVTRVFVTHGQAIRACDPLVELRLTGAELATAQANLRQEINQRETLDARIARITPLVESGAQRREDLIEAQNERDLVETRIATRQQELLLYGLKPEQVASIVAGGDLIRELVIRLPANIVDPEAIPCEERRDSAEPQPLVPTAAESDGPLPDENAAAAPWQFTVESLAVHPGQAVKPGDALVHVAHHTELWVRGEAYEHEIGLIEDLEAKGWPVQVEFGTAGYESYRRDLEVLHIENHVDPEERTHDFYVPLENEPVLPDRVGAGGRVFRTWRFKPGQRVHVLVPTRELEGLFRLPLEAVVEEGLVSHVFKRGRVHYETVGGEAVRMTRFDRVPAKVVHRDTRFVHVAPSPELREGMRIAAGHAYQLNLASKEDAGGGHDPHHGHSH